MGKSRGTVSNPAPAPPKLPLPDADSRHSAKPSDCRNGAEPFKVPDNFGKNYHGPVVVLTRAKINFAKLLDFWRHVPRAHASLDKSEGVLLALGIGENPVTQQATLSVWDSVESLTQFAYQRPGHREVVKRTRQRGWYGEELFARFVPVAGSGGAVLGKGRSEHRAEKGAFLTQS